LYNNSADSLVGKLWLNNLKNGDSSYNNFEKRIADILRNLPAGDNIFYSDIYDLFLHDTPSGPVIEHYIL
jgi:hypothetical protein